MACDRVGAIASQVNRGERKVFPKGDYFLPLVVFLAGAAFGEGAGLAAGFATGFLAAAIIHGS
jgi:hypothetical protein